MEEGQIQQAIHQPLFRPLVSPIGCSPSDGAFFYSARLYRPGASSRDNGKTA
jgi:hypothetical protein